jgi:electron transfer flavoprotein beta subunit
MEPPPNVPPVVNGFDENAVEAALRIKDALGAKVTVISLGKSFALDIMKKPLSMGCDEMVLLKDDAFEGVDAFGTAQALVAAIKKVGQFDLVLCGRQASDYDQATVPLGIAELLNIPCITIAQRVEVREGVVIVERTAPDGHETFEAPLPAVVTVSNELGQPRYPTLRGIMAASRKQPVVWTLADLGLGATALASKVELLELFQPSQSKECAFIEGDSDEEKGRQLALKLREAKLI